MFDQVHQFVQNLDNIIKNKYPRIYEHWEDDAQVMGTLQDADWDTLTRSGYHNKGPYTFAPYKMERDGLRVFVSAKMDSESFNIQEVSVRVTLGWEINEQISEDCESANFVIDSDSEVQLET